MTDYLKQSTDYNDSAIASAFDELSFWSSRFAKLLFDHIEILRGINVLDVGSGTGFPLFELAHTHGSSCQFTGIDIWKEGLSRAAKKQGAWQLENVSFLMADGAHLPFPDAGFDLIVSHLGINNFEKPQEVLSECFRVAKPRARLILTSNLKGHMREFYDLYRETLISLGLSHHLDRLAVNEDHRGTKESICKMVKESGFQISKAVEDYFHLRYLDGSTLLRHPLTRFGFLEGWRAVVDSEDENRVFSMLESRLNEISRERGGLKMRIPMLYLEGKSEK